jgi:Fe-Mn family superoxide dismutase
MTTARLKIDENKFKKNQNGKELYMHTAKNFDHLIGQIPGLSEKQLKAHFGLYQGYVKKLNEIEEKLATSDRSAANYSFADVSELHRRHAVAYNGAYLHQLYFENLTGKKTKPSGELMGAIEKNFGNLEKWFADVKAGLITAPGWVLVARSRIDGTLRNCVIEEHHRGLLAEHDILIALDGWEHAYMIDYGTSKADYIKILEPAIDWEAASQRFSRR